MRDDERVAAARNNAEWCDIVCGSHGLPGRTDADAWSVPRRSPQWYPDAVTLRPGVDAEALLARLDAGPGATVKDSFADLDLSGYGFRVLFDAQWIQRQPAAPPADAPLDRVSTPDDLASWAEAHGGGALFRPALLADPRVLVLARHDDRGELTGGAVLSGDGPYGVSNLFTRTGTAHDVWRAVCATVPDAPLVGYETTQDLSPALRAGFTTTGPLRVWSHG
ncbi:hypothetical protein KBX53_26855 [Micromonospora sp. M51]|uniref:GNAT family N-acetyltransferase n=1 Tax=Micromonospora parva TaxID=1464048 RepID=A0ABW6W087_9ACTN|nr:MULTISPECIES: hypothetical protein [unclassified Micromonospora]MBQ1014496.1 hypothetical protein [Micromonospora sp. M51]MBQ1032190.1 hypothetical protein [Micromonospora sp. C97]